MIFFKILPLLKPNLVTDTNSSVESKKKKLTVTDVHFCGRAQILSK